MDYFVTIDVDNVEAMHDYVLRHGGRYTWREHAVLNERRNYCLSHITIDRAGLGLAPKWTFKFFHKHHAVQVKIMFGGSL